MGRHTLRTPLGAGSRGHTLLALAALGLALLGLGAPAHAADVTVQPAPGAGFVVTDNTGAAQRFKVLESGEVFLGGLSPVPPVKDTPLCYNATTGQVGGCPGAPGATGLVDNGDGTVTDNKTGLMWEKKTGTVGGNVNCTLPTDCPDPHVVNNIYQWSSFISAPDGGTFTNFLDRVNGRLCATSTCPGLAGHSDWRLPTLAELQTIVDLSATGCGTGSPCINPVFGPTVPDQYWSFATNPAFLSEAWLVKFQNGTSGLTLKTDHNYVRAVRGGL